MINKLAFTTALLVAPILLVGCFTQLGYDTAPRMPPRGTNQIDESETLNKHEDIEDHQASVEEESETEKDGGYYGRRKRNYDRHIPYYDGYHYSEPYPYYYSYYSPYYSYYPYYSYHPYYRSYGYRNSYRYGRKHHRRYTPRYYKNRDFHHGKGRTRSHRGVGNRRSSSDRPSPKMDRESDRTTPKDGTLRRRESRRYQRRR